MLKILLQEGQKLLEYRIKENSMLLDKCLKDTPFNDETLVVGIKREDELLFQKEMINFC